MSVQWTETAIDQLQAIRNYLARSSTGYAQALVARIVARADSLANQPLLGAEVEEYSDPTVREVFEHPYRVMYRVVGSVVFVIAVIHASRKLPRTTSLTTASGTSISASGKRVIHLIGGVSVEN